MTDAPKNKMIGGSKKKKVRSPKNHSGPFTSFQPEIEGSFLEDSDLYKELDLKEAK
jgi:hypothetical protein